MASNPTAGVYPRGLKQVVNTTCPYGHSSSSHSVEKVEAAKGPWLEQQVHKTWSLHAVQCHSALINRDCDTHYKVDGPEGHCAE